MKYLAVLLTILTLPAFAGGNYEKSQSNAVSNATSESASEALSKSNSSAQAMGGTVEGVSSASSVVDSGNATVELVNNVDMADAVTYYGESSVGDTVVNTGSVVVEGDIDIPALSGTTSEVKVGDRTIPIPNFSLGIGRVDSHKWVSNIVQGTVSLPLIRWWKQIDTADQLDRIKQNERTERHNLELLQMSERHEVEINILCHKLHVAGMLAGEGICKGKMYTDVNHTPEVRDIGLDFDRIPGHQ